MQKYDDDQIAEHWFQSCLVSMMMISGVQKSPPQMMKYCYHIANEKLNGNIDKMFRFKKIELPPEPITVPMPETGSYI